jgi:hypothetical protein
MVTVNMLDQKHKYTCISHTWGRWGIGNFIAMSGVPWMVPQTTRSDVEQLPEVLHHQ